MKRKRRGKGKTLIVAGGAALILFVVVALIGSLGGGGDKEATATVVAADRMVQATGTVPTETPLPTATEAPTETATRPAATEAPTATPTPSATSGRAEAQVSRIVDGDTIVVVIDGQSYDLRYIGIDSAEVGDAFGAEATAGNEALVGGKTVYLEKDVSETDRYDRLLRYVYLADGTFVNAELVRQGFAEAKDYPPDSKYREVLDAAEQEARVALVGVWAVAPTATVPVRGGTIATATASTPVGADVRIVKVFNSGKKEYIEISNRGGGPQEMSGWSVSGSRGDERYYFANGYVLEAGATVRLHSGTDGVDAPPGDIYWTEKTVWNNDGETAYLWDGSGKVVSEYRY